MRQSQELVVTFVISSSEAGDAIHSLIVLNAKIESIGVVERPNAKAGVKANGKAREELIETLTKAENGMNRELLLAQYKSNGGNGKGFGSVLRALTVTRRGRVYLKKEEE